MLARWSHSIKNLRWTWDDTISLGQLNHLKQILLEILPSKTSTMYGTSLIFNNQTNSDLGSDWYDNYQAPQLDGKQLFERRMWVSGSLRFGSIPKIGDHLRCAERVSLVRRVGESVFVTIERETKKLSITQRLSGANWEVTGSEEGESLVSEIRTLVYKQKEDDQACTVDNGHQNTSKVGQHSSCDKSAEFVISEGQVSRFSALSYNLHKIHHDKNYSKEEGLSDVVVLGPMLVNVMLHYFALEFPAKEIKSFTYRMSEPCYVNRVLRIELRRAIAKDSHEVSVWDNSRNLCHGIVREKSTYG